MCLVLFAYRKTAGYPLIVAANRDEFHLRASTTAEFWDDHPDVMAGRDLVAQGTWLGATRTGRFAALTNFTRPEDPPAKVSRGHLVGDFLTGDSDAEAYASQINEADYAGYNLLLFDGEDLVYTSNRAPTQRLAPGYYGLANAELGAAWPKCEVGAQSLAAITQREHEADELITLLADQSIPADDALPQRGRPIEMERRIAPYFILGDEYGTRASTIVHLGETHSRFVEQSYAAGGVSTAKVAYEFKHLS